MEEKRMMLNMDDIKEFQVTEPGIYTGRLDNADIIMSTNSGDPYIKTEWVCTITQDGVTADRRFWKNISLSLKSQWALKQLCVAVGDPRAQLPIWYENGIANCDEQKMRAWILGKIGVQAELQITVKQYEGEPKNDVKKLIAIIGKGAASPKRVASGIKRV